VEEKVPGLVNDKFTLPKRPRNNQRTREQRALPDSPRPACTDDDVSDDCLRRGEHDYQRDALNRPGPLRLVLELIKEVRIGVETQPHAQNRDNYSSNEDRRSGYPCRCRSDRH